MRQEIANVLEILIRDILAELSALPAEALNWQPPLPDANSLYVLATHTVGAGEWWVLHMACQQAMTRDRAAEFRSAGDLASLTRRYQAWLADSQTALASLPDAELNAKRHFQSSSGPLDWSVAMCLLHAVDHTATHLGHIQITRQLWEQGPGAQRG